MSQFGLLETYEEAKLVLVCLFPPSLLPEFVLPSPIISYTLRVLNIRINDKWKSKSFHIIGCFAIRKVPLFSNSAVM
jgi:hypothetical protein